MKDSDKPRSDPASEMADFLKLAATEGGGPSRPAALDDQIAQLQNQVADLDDRLHEERFLWALVVIIMFDVSFLLKSDNWSAPLIIGVLELFGLITFAARCRVNPIMPVLDKFVGVFGKGNGKDT
jgi:hypothetical protein